MTILTELGSLPLRIGNLINTTVHGGTLDGYPYWSTCVLVTTRKLESGYCDIRVPAEQGDAPDMSVFREGLVKALMNLINGFVVYVGSDDGLDGVGLFLAGLAKVQIEYRRSKHRSGRGEDSLGYVHKHYSTLAVLTEEQKQFLDDFDASEIVEWLNVTQVAFRLGGFTPSKEDASKEHLGDPEKKTGIYFKDSDGNERFRAAWKKRYHDAKLCELGDEYDSAYDEELVEVVEPLQSQFDRVIDLIEEMAAAAVKSHEFVVELQEQHDKLVNACRLGFKAVSKPTFWDRIQAMFDRAI